MKTRIIIVAIALLTSGSFALAQQRGSERSGEKKEKSEVKATRPERPSQGSPSPRSASPSRARESSSPATVHRGSGAQRTQQPARSSSQRETPAVTHRQPGRAPAQRADQGTNRRSSGNDPAYRGDPAVKERQPANQGTLRRGEPSHSNGGRRVEPGQSNTYRSERKVVYSRPVYHHYEHIPETRVYRSIHFPYRPPVMVRIVWNVDVFHYYRRLYPLIGYWDYNPYYTVYTISAYDAFDHVGQIRRVYGQVYETFYFRDSDEYFLYIGAYYPYHDFTVIVPGHIARRFSWNPERYFDKEFIEVTGLITEFEGRPEIEVRSRTQLDRY